MRRERILEELEDFSGSFSSRTNPSVICSGIPYLIIFKERKKWIMENQEKKSNKKKWILIGAGGAALLVGGIFIGKKIGVKIGKDSIAKFPTQFGNVARDTIVSQPIPLPEEVSSIWKDIDEDVFVNIATEIENALCDNNINDLHLERSWDVAEGVTKYLKVTMDTIKA